MVPLGPARGAWVLLGTALLLAGTALAHPSHGPTLGERYLSLTIGAGRCRLVYGLTFAGPQGLAERRAADRTGDGRIDDGERAERAASFASTVRDGLSVLVDGRPARLCWSEPFLGPAEAVRAGPLAAEVVATFELPGGDRVVTVEDRAELEGIYRTTVSVEAEPGLELSAAGRGRAPVGVETRLVFLDLPSPDPPSPRVVTVAVRGPAGAGPRWARPAAVAGAGIFGLLVMALALLARRRRSARRRRA